MNLKTILELLAFGLACFVLGGYFLPPVARQHIAEWVQTLRTPKSKRKAKEPEPELSDEWKHDPITRNTRPPVTAAAPMTSSEDQPDQSGDAPSAALMSDDSSEGLSAESGPQLSGEEDLDGAEGEQGEGLGCEADGRTSGEDCPGAREVVPDKVVGIVDEGLGEGENAQGEGSPFGEAAGQPAETPSIGDSPPESSPEKDIERAKRLLRDKGFSVLKREEPEKKRKTKRRPKRKNIKKK